MITARRLDHPPTLAPLTTQRRLPALILFVTVCFAPLAFAAIVYAPRAADAAAGVTLPTSIRATYKVYKAGILLGRVDETFECVGDRYKITSATRAEGPLRALIRDEISYVSEGKIGAAGLVPSVFSSTRKSDTAKSFTSRFDWDTYQLVRESHQRDPSGTVERESFDLPLGTQDRLSSMYQFMITIPKAARIETQMTQGKHTEKYFYVKLDEPIMTTPAGRYSTVHYVREAKAGESKAELWLAKEFSYLPVRVIFTDSKDSSLEQQLVELAIR